MHRLVPSLAALCLLCGAGAALRLEQFASQTSYDPLVDYVLASFLQRYPYSFIPFTPLSIGFTAPASGGPRPALKAAAPVGELTATRGSFGNIQSLVRTKSVTSSIASGNLTLGATVKFNDLVLSYAEAEIRVFNVSFDTTIRISVSQNEFTLLLTLFTNQNGTCAVDVHEAQFTLLSGIVVEVTPQGFFNQIQISSHVNHLTQTILSQFNNFNKFFLVDELEKAFCSIVPN